ncbi:hypothetical protein AF60_02335 [Streptococcus uberis S6261]|nr:hypothetical protein AF63_08680 [Streptococcus uberis Ab71]KKF41027.1 hypothetical protein AF64_08980 [Streptococcus uberis C9359]KKF41462.1 hypothetical protein AF61_01590 [Streptococcus uberis EF20/0145]KKF46288.1 hypothetical protein AF59_01865 [Streptococcus uberis C5072]KKF47045.1 hypothetical protein AF60_02335 [Streptococcus uberis S6261]KKF47504.1 hypothetical protein AF62_09340 [Streptococcus uberis C8329]KKF51882.1 hypothetical protein AF65_09040 [Streptococcus uberis C5388]KKF5
MSHTRQNNFSRKKGKKQVKSIKAKKRKVRYLKSLQIPDFVETIV